MIEAFQRLLGWAAKNERRIGAVVFVFGFISDVLTFTLLPFNLVNIYFISFLTFAAICALGSHILPNVGEGKSWFVRTLSVLFPLGAQYALGNLLSGFVVFYSKNAEVAVSWPFILILVLAYIGSEYFRKYKTYLIFQTSLFFLVLYAYLIFALPLLVHTIGPWVFAGSTLAACVLFGVFLLLLRRLNQNRYLESRRNIVAAAAVLLAVVNVAYFTELIPPLPLTLTDSGVYHTLTKVPGGYLVKGEEEKPWWDIRTTTVHATPGEAVYAFSAVKAPAAFGSAVTHVWEHQISGKWVKMSEATFPISGGREGGYRGYSQATVAPGAWRVSVKTENGQVIGRIRFNVESTSVVPALFEKTL